MSFFEIRLVKIKKKWIHEFWKTSDRKVHKLIAESFFSWIQIFEKPRSISPKWPKQRIEPPWLPIKDTLRSSKINFLQVYYFLVNCANPKSPFLQPLTLLRNGILSITYGPSITIFFGHTFTESSYIVINKNRYVVTSRTYQHTFDCED